MHSAFSPFKLLSSMTLQYLQGAHQDVSEEKERSEASWRASMSWARQLGISCLHFILTQFQWQNALTNLQLIDCRGSPRRCKIRKMPKQKQNTKWFNLGCVLFSGRLTHTQWLRQIVSKAILVGHVVPVYSQNVYMGYMFLHHFQFWTPTYLEL